MGVRHSGLTGLHHSGHVNQGATKARQPAHHRQVAPSGREVGGPRSDASSWKYLELLPLPGGLTVILLQQAMPGVRAVDANTWVIPLNAACKHYEITGSLRRMAAFLGHIAHESGNLRHLEENLNYKDPHRINQTFGAIKTDKEAEAYAHNPEGLANKVYADRAGNGDTASGDGWKYRGRGLIQLTGKANYAAFGQDINVDVVKNPELVATPQYAALSAAWYWKKHRLNRLADAEMYQAVSKGINKSLASFPEREKKRKWALNALCRAVMTDLASSLAHGGFGGLW